MKRPPYFDRIAETARNRWEQLEADPVLAAPWHTLFNQIQDARHVLSELLQNADDAGATFARAEIVDDEFHFTHDGQDFDEQALESICRFGFSNKRHLHTIGFRGLGFKSVFSLGPYVEICTPTLAFAFRNTRFTDPLWLDDAPPTELTYIRAPIVSPEVVQQLQANLREWSNSPIPLLFFKSIARLELQGVTATKVAMGPGPLEGSQSIVLRTDQSERHVLYVESSEEPFPEEAIAEVRKERQYADFELPPCRVSMVLTTKTGPIIIYERAYVVLPTEIRPELPFSFNAPFIQDPARTGLKDPVRSPTNRWLLERVGRLAATAMLTWLKNTGLTIEDRADAYQLVPDNNVMPASSSADCTRVVRDSFKQTLHSKPYLLDFRGELVTRQKCLDIPPQLMAVWLPEDLIRIFGASEATVIASEVTAKFRERLAVNSHDIVRGFLPKF